MSHALSRRVLTAILALSFAVPAVSFAAASAPASEKPAAVTAAKSDIVKFGDPTTQEQEALTNDLDSMVGETGTHVPGVGVIVYKDGYEVYSHFAGRRFIAKDAKEKNLPVTRDTRFRAASVSKMFTGFTIMQLVDQGKLKLDDDISTYLGFNLRNPNYPDTPITIRMLLSHTSSLRDGALYSIPPDCSVSEFFKPTGKFYENGAHFAPKGQAPGKYFKYSNINYGLLGTIIEKVTGERFDRYQKEHILKDLDIKADYTPGALAPSDFKNLGTIYQKNNKGKWNEKGAWYAQIDDYRGVQPPADEVKMQNPDHRDTDAFYSLKDYVPGTNATFFSPQGGLRISYEELSHALEMLLNDGKYKGRTVVRPDLLKEMMTPQWIYNPQEKNGSTYGGTIEAYGLSLYPIIGNSTSRVVKDHVLNLWGHTGEAYGLLSGVFIIPGTKDGFIYMMNGEAVAEDDDPRSAGKFSGNYVWEENVMNAICSRMFF
jgi:D-alanyl-D-alanine carboxypeptidase